MALSLVKPTASDGSQRGLSSGGARPLIIVDRKDQRWGTNFRNLDNGLKRMITFMLDNDSEEWLGIWHAEYGVYIAQCWSKQRMYKADRTLTLSVGLKVWHQQRASKLLRIVPSANKVPA